MTVSLVATIKKEKQSLAPLLEKQCREEEKNRRSDEEQKKKRLTEGGKKKKNVLKRFQLVTQRSEQQLRSRPFEGQRVAMEEEITQVAIERR